MNFWFENKGEDNDSNYHAMEGSTTLIRPEVLLPIGGIIIEAELILRVD